MIRFTDEDEIEAAFQYYRKTGFPYPNLQRHEIIHIFRELQASKSKINRRKYKSLFNEKQTKTIEVSHLKDRILAESFHPHIFTSHATGMRSPLTSFAIDKSLRKAISQCLQWYAITDTYVKMCTRVINGTQMCSNFRPSAAKAIYEYLGGNSVLDMSTGYGGRLIGFLASKLTGAYTGIDPSRLTVRGNKAIASEFGAAKRVHLILGAFEDIPLERLPKVDIAFTSPPYFAKEIYDESEKGKQRQSRERYPDYKTWRGKFLRVLIQKSIQCLRKNGALALNIADVTIKGKRYPLVKDSLSIATSYGWPLDERLEISFPAFGKGLDRRKTEPVLIFRAKR